MGRNQTFASDRRASASDSVKSEGDGLHACDQVRPFRSAPEAVISGFPQNSRKLTLASVEHTLTSL